jgi:hypothetical protein
VAKALRTGRKHIPIHPVKVKRLFPEKPAVWDDDAIREALRKLKGAAYNGDVERVRLLEATLDRLVGAKENPPPG